MEVLDFLGVGNTDSSCSKSSFVCSGKEEVL